MKRKRTSLAQSATEYMILLGVTTAIVIGGWQYYMTTTATRGEEFFNAAMWGIMGNRLVADPNKYDYP